MASSPPLLLLLSITLGIPSLLCSTLVLLRILGPNPFFSSSTSRQNANSNSNLDPLFLNSSRKMSSETNRSSLTLVGMSGRTSRAGKTSNGMNKLRASAAPSSTCGLGTSSDEAAHRRMAPPRLRAAQRFVCYLAVADQLSVWLFLGLSISMAIQSQSSQQLHQHAPSVTSALASYSPLTTGLLTGALLARPILSALVGLTSWTHIHLGRSIALGASDHRLWGLAFVSNLICSLAVSLVTAFSSSPSAAATTILCFWLLFGGLAGLTLTSLAHIVWSAGKLSSASNPRNGTLRPFLLGRIPRRPQRPPAPAFLSPNATDLTSPSERQDRPPSSRPISLERSMHTFGGVDDDMWDNNDPGLTRVATMRKSDVGSTQPTTTTTTTSEAYDSRKTGKSSAMASSLDAYGVRPNVSSFGKTRGFEKQGASWGRRSEKGHIVEGVPTPVADGDISHLVLNVEEKASPSYKGAASTDQDVSQSRSEEAQESSTARSKEGEVQSSLTRSTASHSLGSLGMVPRHTYDPFFQGTFGSSENDHGMSLGSPSIHHLPSKDLDVPYDEHRAKPRRSPSPLHWASEGELRPKDLRNPSIPPSSVALPSSEPGYVTIRSFPSVLSFPIELATQGGGEDLLGASGAVLASVEKAAKDVPTNLHRARRDTRTSHDYDQRLGGDEVDRALWRIGGCFVGVVLPFVIALPALILNMLPSLPSPTAVNVLLAFAVTLSAPLLAFQTLKAERMTRGEGEDVELDSPSVGRQPHHLASDLGHSRSHHSIVDGDMDESPVAGNGFGGFNGYDVPALRTLTPSGATIRTIAPSQQGSGTLYSAAPGARGHRSTPSVPYLAQHWTAGRIVKDRVVESRHPVARAFGLMLPHPRLEVLPGGWPSPGETNSADISLESANTTIGGMDDNDEGAASDGAQAASGSVMFSPRTPHPPGAMVLSPGPASSSDDAPRRPPILDGLSALLLPRLLPGLSIGPDVLVADDDELTLCETYDAYIREVANSPQWYSFADSPHAEIIRQARSVRMMDEDEHRAPTPRSTSSMSMSRWDSRGQPTPKSSLGPTASQTPRLPSPLSMDGDGVQSTSTPSSSHRRSVSSSVCHRRRTPSQSSAGLCGHSMELESGSACKSSARSTSVDLGATSLGKMGLIPLSPSEVTPNAEASQSVASPVEESLLSQPECPSLRRRSLSSELGLVKTKMIPSIDATTTHTPSSSKPVSQPSSIPLDRFGSAQRRSLGNELGMISMASHHSKTESDTPNSRRTTADSSISSILSSCASTSEFIISPDPTLELSHPDGDGPRSPPEDAQVLDLEGPVEDQDARTPRQSMVELEAGKESATTAVVDVDEQLVEAVTAPVPVATNGEDDLHLDPLTLHRVQYPALPLETLDEVTEEPTLCSDWDADVNASLDEARARAEASNMTVDGDVADATARSEDLAAAQATLEDIEAVLNQVVPSTPSQAQMEREASTKPWYDTPCSSSPSFGWASQVYRISSSQSDAEIVVTNGSASSLADLALDVSILDTPARLAPFDGTFWASSPASIPPLSEMPTPHLSPSTSIRFERDAEWVEAEIGDEENRPPASRRRSSGGGSGAGGGTSYSLRLSTASITLSSVAGGASKKGRRSLISLKRKSNNEAVARVPVAVAMAAAQPATPSLKGSRNSSSNRSSLGKELAPSPWKIVEQEELKPQGGSQDQEQDGSDGDGDGDVERTEAVDDLALRMPSDPPSAPADKQQPLIPSSPEREARLVSTMISSPPVSPSRPSARPKTASPEHAVRRKAPRRKKEVAVVVAPGRFRLQEVDEGGQEVTPGWASASVKALPDVEAKEWVDEAIIVNPSSESQQQSILEKPTAEVCRDDPPTQAPVETPTTMTTVTVTARTTTTTPSRRPRRTPLSEVMTNASHLSDYLFAPLNSTTTTTTTTDKPLPKTPRKTPRINRAGRTDSIKGKAKGQLLGDGTGTGTPKRQTSSSSSSSAATQHKLKRIRPPTAREEDGYEVTDKENLCSISTATEKNAMSKPLTTTKATSGKALSFHSPLRERRGPRPHRRTPHIPSISIVGNSGEAGGSSTMVRSGSGSGSSRGRNGLPEVHIRPPSYSTSVPIVYRFR